MSKTLCDPNAPFGFKVGDIVEFKVGPRIGTSIGRVAGIRAANVIMQDIGHYGKQLYIQRGRVIGPAEVPQELVMERLANIKPASLRKSRTAAAYEGSLHGLMSRLDETKATLGETEIAALTKIEKKYHKGLNGLRDLLSEETKQELVSFKIETTGDAAAIVKSAHGFCKLLLRRAKQAVKRSGNNIMQATHAVVANEQHATM